jgi:hypothetical protein
MTAEGIMPDVKTWFNISVNGLRLCKEQITVLK